ncbi:hypothetical protein LguiB_001979 [Lonicera macranthoides]
MHVVEACIHVYNAIIANIYLPKRLSIELSLHTWIHVPTAWVLMGSVLVQRFLLNPHPHSNLLVMVSTLEEIEKYVSQIKMILESMEGGELTTSGYDTAMVALVEDINGSGSPQFPSCIEWIANNQMEDGSWGAPYLFAYSDRLINTLACIVALKKWNLHPHKIQKGITFFKENFNNLANENEEHMLIGFEIAFPGLVRKARKYGIEVPGDSHPILKDINAKRDYKLSKIPKEVLQTEHTTLLFSAEGLEDLDMEKLLKLQCPDGSMLYSPASTAHVLTHTKDPNCLKYLNHVVDRSNGGDAFWHFKYGDAFCCFPRQSSESVTAIFDLFRATQLQFPGEKVMDEAKNFSYNFLRKREANNTLIDKWVILKDLPGEVGYALDMPYFANLPRVETRIYIEQYGGEEDVWIGKTLYHYNVGGRLTGILRRTLYQLSMDAMEAHGGDILQPLLHAHDLGNMREPIMLAISNENEWIQPIDWEMWLMTWQEEDVIPQSEAVLLATTTNIFADRLVSGELLSHPQYKRLTELTDRICHHLYKFQDKKVQDDCRGNTKSNNITTVEIESDMQELLKLVLQKSEDGIDSKIKQTFLAVTKSYYYITYCSPSTINIHMDKILFVLDNPNNNKWRECIKVYNAIIANIYLPKRLSIEVPIVWVLMGSVLVQRFLLNPHPHSNLLVMVSTLVEIEKYVSQIKMILESMEGGELTTSGYDTAMVALVEDINGSGSPQFPSCLEWIANNQMEDGSWGAPYLFAYSDRLINTLACIVALKKWNLHPHKIQKGITFFKENFNNLANENEEHMLIGFEIAFPGLVRKARKYGIEVPDDSHPILKDINAKRDYKLSKYVLFSHSSKLQYLCATYTDFPSNNWLKDFQRNHLILRNSLIDTLYD